MRTTTKLGASLAAVALLLGACGDDDGQEADAETSGADATDAPGTGDGDLAAFCDAAVEGDALFSAGPETQGDAPPTPEALAAFGAELAPLVDRVESSAPDEIAGDVRTLVAGVRAALEEGDPAAAGTEAVMRADAAIDGYVFDHCELAGTLDAVAVDYGYEGLPADIPAGRVGIRLANEGDEVHEAAVMRIADGEERPLEELLALPEEEAAQLARPAGAVVAAPGEEQATVLDLEPGRYVVMCFVPVGTTSVEGEPGSGPPHVAQGMVAEITVG